MQSGVEWVGTCELMIWSEWSGVGEVRWSHAWQGDEKLSVHLLRLLSPAFRGRVATANNTGVPIVKAFCKPWSVQRDLLQRHHPTPSPANWMGMGKCLSRQFALYLHLRFDASSRNPWQTTLKSTEMHGNKMQHVQQMSPHTSVGKLCLPEFPMLLNSSSSQRSQSPRCPWRASADSSTKSSFASLPSSRR